MSLLNNNNNGWQFNEMATADHLTSTKVRYVSVVGRLRSLCVSIDIPESGSHTMIFRNVCFAIAFADYELHVLLLMHSNLFSLAGCAWVVLVHHHNKYYLFLDILLESFSLNCIQHRSVDSKLKTFVINSSTKMKITK